ncbi:MAG TPA: hypothetical protein VGE04_06895, partial [Chloroflexia bacterium]
EDKSRKAHYSLQFPFFPTHLIPHCVRNDKGGFSPFHCGMFDGSRPAEQGTAIARIDHDQYNGAYGTAPSGLAALSHLSRTTPARSDGVGTLSCGPGILQLYQLPAPGYRFAYSLFAASGVGST